MGAEPTHIGMICDPEHEVFGRVAELLRDRGHALTFFEPGVDVPPARLDDLDLLVNKKIRWESLHALEYAHRNGVAAWNGYLPTMVFVNRLSQVAALDAVGFRTPETLLDPPTGDYVGREFLNVQNEPTLNGPGAFYQPLLASDGVDRKYYAVDEGRSVHTVALEFRSKLFGRGEFLRLGDVDPEIRERITRLLRFTGARAVGVDVIEVDGHPVAVDANPATSFRHTGLEEAIADSIARAAAP